MILSNRAKSFLAALAILMLCFGCRWWQNIANTNTSPVSEAFPEDRSDIPFSTREPDVYQARMVISAGGTERAAFIARNGARRRCDYNAGSESEWTWLKTDKEYLILPAKKSYAEKPVRTEKGLPSSQLDSLTVEWLNIKAGSKFTDLGTENGLRKFSAKLDQSDVSEILLFIDEATGLPVRQEFYSIAGDRRDLAYAVELRDIKLEAADDLFTIPKGFRKISPEEFRAAMTKK